MLISNPVLHHCSLELVCMWIPGLRRIPIVRYEVSPHMITWRVRILKVDSEECKILFFIIIIIIIFITIIIIIIIISSSSAQDRNYWRALVNAALNLGIP